MKKEIAYNKLKALLDNPSKTLCIHCSRQDFTDNGKTPRVTAIIIKSLDGSINKTIAINLEAEKVEVIWEEIESYYDQLEERVIKEFNRFTKEHKNQHWLHWDMDGVHFGFEAIMHRYCVLVDKDGKDFNEVPVLNRVNLNTYLKSIYGSNYENEPVFENLMKSNNGGVCTKGYLTLEDEAKAFINSEYHSIIESISCKVNFLSEILHKVANKTLKVTNNRKKVKDNGSLDEHAIISLIKNWTFWTVIVFLGGVAFGLGKYFGENRFDKEKLDLHDQNILIQNSNDSLNISNKKLRQENDSLMLKVSETKVDSVRKP